MEIFSLGKESFLKRILGKNGKKQDPQEVSDPAPCLHESFHKEKTENRECLPADYPHETVHKLALRQRIHERLIVCRVHVLQKTVGDMIDQHSDQGKIFHPPRVYGRQIYPHPVEPLQKSSHSRFLRVLQIILLHTKTRKSSMDFRV
jgi:hypothetical protein